MNIRVLSAPNEGLGARLCAARDGETVVLENREYHITEEDCFLLTGCYCSNTATQAENPDGQHRAAAFLSDKKKVTIEGNGARIIIHGVATPFVFNGCKGLTVRNLTVDYARPTMSEFTVVKRTEKGYLLSIAEEYLYELRGEKLVWLGERGADGKPRWEKEYRGEKMLSMYYDPQTERTKFLPPYGSRFPSVPTFASAEKTDGGVVVTLRDTEASLPVGCVIQTRDVTRDELGGFFVDCENLRLENVRICAMHGFGLLAQSVKNITYKDLDCTPKQGRTIASNADFFHFTGCRGKILIEGCRAAGGHDDFINVHGIHLTIERAEEKTLTLRFPHPQTWGFEAFGVGDKIELIAWNTLRPYARTTVEAVERLDDTRIRLRVRDPLPAVTDGKDAVENATRTASLTVRGCRFGPSMGRGVLSTTRKKITITGNVFYKTGGSVLSVEDDCNFWYESGYVKDLEFTDNLVEDGTYGAGNDDPPVVYVEPKVLEKTFNGYVHGRIKIAGNTFVQRSGKKLYHIRYTREPIVEDNEVKENER